MVVEGLQGLCREMNALNEKLSLFVGLKYTLFKWSPILVAFGHCSPFYQGDLRPSMKVANQLHLLRMIRTLNNS